MRTHLRRRSHDDRSTSGGSEAPVQRLHCVSIHLVNHDDAIRGTARLGEPKQLLYRRDVNGVAGS
jgi:hypothetical protein